MWERLRAIAWTPKKIAEKAKAVSRSKIVQGSVVAILGATGLYAVQNVTKTASESMLEKAVNEELDQKLTANKKAILEKVLNRQLTPVVIARRDNPNIIQTVFAPTEAMTGFFDNQKGTIPTSEYLSNGIKYNGYTVNFNTFDLDIKDNQAIPFPTKVVSRNRWDSITDADDWEAFGNQNEKYVILGADFDGNRLHFDPNIESVWGAPKKIASNVKKDATNIANNLPTENITERLENSVDRVQPSSSPEATSQIPTTEAKKTEKKDKWNQPSSSTAETHKK